MNVKRLSAAALALALGAALSPASLALPEGAALYGRPAEEVSVSIPDKFAAFVTVNGKPLEPVTFYNYDEETFQETEVTMSVDDLPGCPAGYVPMRLLCAADPNGYAEWVTAENSAVFSFHKNSFIVYFDDLSVELDGEKVEGVKAYLDHDGVTFLPVDFLATLPDVEVDDHPEIDTEHYDFTLVVAPIVALANQLREEAGSNASFELTVDDLVNIYNVPAGAIEELAAYAPMMTSPDTVIVAKVSADKQAAVAEAFEAYIKQQVETFTWYLADQLPKAENGKVVTEGEYMMLFIGEDSAKAEELFKAGVAGLE